MWSSEPLGTALLLAVIGLLLAVSAVFSRASRLGIPIILVFLLIGVLAGSEGIGGIEFEDYHLAFRVGVVALVLILFDGGLNTPRRLLREVAGPAVTLATLGVVGTALLVGVGARVIGFGWAEALLLGAIVSCTDAAAVFSLLRSSELQLRRRVAVTLEAESGLNDPMAVALTLTLTELVAGRSAALAGVMHVVLQLVVGAILGWLIGQLGRWTLGRLRLATGGLHTVLTLAIAFLAFAVPTLAFGSGFLAVYVAGVVLGNGPLPHRTAVLRVHDALAWLAQVVMFLALGLLVFPSRLMAVAVPGLMLALVLALLVRPLVTIACLAPFRYRFREQLYIGWMGLRGAVPVVLATYPVLAGITAGERIFDLVFFVVVASVLLQGSTARWVTQRLGMAMATRPAPQAVIELSSSRPLRKDLVSFFITPEAAVAGLPLAEVPFPPGAGAVMVIREDELLAPRGDIVLEPGDHVYVFSRPEDRPVLQLLFGQVEVG
jgi:potassium/hydrogen antiporter